MNRRNFIQAAAALTAAAQWAGAEQQSKHIVLFTSDGVRWQDLFTGIDASLMNQKKAGMADVPELQKRLWRPTAEERREALMPFFWKTLIPKGIVLGNAAKSSPIEVSNRYRVSYPGYSEILTGRAQDDVITGNDPVQNPTPSFLQFLKQKQKLSADQVAVFASWDNFHYSAENQRGALYINAGYDISKLPEASPMTEKLNQMQFDARYISDDSRHDAFTFGLAMEYLKKVQPEHMFISFDETDDWAHSRRYDRVLESLQYFDRSLKTLWDYLQSTPRYADSTTLVITTDHGRGSTLQDFSDHGPDVAGDQMIWAAFIGPGIPATGEAKSSAPCYQRDIAPTILDLLGFDYRQYAGVKGKPIAEVTGPHRQ